MLFTCFTMWTFYGNVVGINFTKCTRKWPHTFRFKNCSQNFFFTFWINHKLCHELLTITLHTSLVIFCLADNPCSYCHFSNRIVIITQISQCNYIANLSLGEIGCLAAVSCPNCCSIWFKINVSLDILKQALIFYH